MPCSIDSVALYGISLRQPLEQLADLSINHQMEFIAWNLHAVNQIPGGHEKGSSLSQKNKNCI